MGEDDLNSSSGPEQDSSGVSPPPCGKWVHQALGGGAVADVLLWKRWGASAFLLVATSIMWFIFERAGYSLLSLVANVLLLLVVMLFFWAKSASLLNRPLPPLPNVEVSEDFIGKAANVAQAWINHVLAVAQNIAVGGDVKIFLQAAFGLWVVSYIGSIFNFLTLIYIGFLLSLTVPVLYDEYQDHVDHKLSVTHKVLSTQYRKIDKNILSKIPMPLSKEKKTQ